MTSKERARLKGLAASEDTIIQVGKGGITDSVVASVDTALAARELVKGRVLESSMLSSREACQSLASACGAEAVQAIGNCFVLYRTIPRRIRNWKREVLLLTSVLHSADFASPISPGLKFLKTRSAAAEKAIPTTRSVSFRQPIRKRI